MRRSLGFSHGEECEPAKVVADKEAARSWVKAHSFEHN